MAGQIAKLGHLDRTLMEPREKVSHFDDSFANDYEVREPISKEFIDVGSQELLQVEIVGVDTPNEKVRLLKLGLRGRPSKFLAGQWLDTFVPGDPKPGGFTIASPPSAAAQANDPYLELAVQEAPENPAAAWLWKPKEEVMRKTLQVRVGGSFVCPPTEGLDGVRHIVLVAGGVGINPLMSILGYIADESEALKVKVSVFYGTKIPEDGDLDKILFLHRIRDLFARGRVAGQFRLFLTGQAAHAQGTNGGGHSGITIKSGRMKAKDILPELRAAGGKDSALVYVCGPPAMTDYFVELMTTTDMASVIDAAHVKSEKWW